VGDHLHNPLETVLDALETLGALQARLFGHLLDEPYKLVEQRQQVFALVFEEGEELFLADQFEEGEREFGLLVGVDFHQLLYDLSENLLLDGKDVAQLFNKTEFIEYGHE